MRWSFLFEWKDEWICLLEYYGELQDEAAKKRYNEKLKFIGCSKDPFWLLESKTRPVSPQSLEWQWPDVSYPDVNNYLIETTSEYTHEQLKAWRDTII